MRNEFFRYLKLFYILFLLGCQESKEEIEEFPKLITSKNIPVQEFSIKSDIDTILIGSKGTTLTIEPNTFVDTNGNLVKGVINLEFKECLTKADIVLGNLTTTSNGQFLESGGMVYVNATSNNVQLQIANNKSISIKMPSDTILENMQLFEGVETENGMNWINPVVIENKNPGNAQEVIVQRRGVLKTSNVAYSVKGYHYGGSYNNPTPLAKNVDCPVELQNKIIDLIWDGDGLMISKDSIIQIDSFEVTLIKTEKGTEWRESDFVETQVQLVATQGQNSFREDSKSNYIFAVKKLGWANIDRLYNDPRTKEIDLIVQVNKQSEFDNIFISMIFKNKNMYLPGYQKKDNSYGFTHGDYEKTSLPVGETVSILMTAYQNKNAYYAIKTFQIKEKETIILDLLPTTDTDLKKQLELL